MDSYVIPVSQSIINTRAKSLSLHEHKSIKEAAFAKALIPHAYSHEDLSRQALHAGDEQSGRLPSQGLYSNRKEHHLTNRQAVWVMHRLLRKDMQDWGKRGRRAG